MYICACLLFVYKIYMLFSHEGSLVLTLAILSCQRKIDSNERSKGRNSNTLEKVYSMGHIFTA